MRLEIQAYSITKEALPGGGGDGGGGGGGGPVSPD